ncbi:MAG: ABC transporter permease [Ruminococcus sp.]|uniref:ABC transporter permease n=1 Tax=Ruminococcus sp. TaxID=41978 RepID=UPI00287315DC|nr:ABC transporter permease [Ruminococcus sp.]MBQ3285934.1 ABC transporter permease [Ruminococcus sp.]
MAKEKRKHIGLWIAGVCFLLIGVVFFVLSYTVAAEIPALLEYSRSRLSPQITFTAYDRLPETNRGDDLVVCGELDPLTVEGVGEIKPVLVNENYFRVYNIHVGGSAITEEHIAGKTPAVVISDKTALAMSVDANVVGQTVSLWGKDYTVVGIYQKPSGFLRGISSDVYDRVYLPYTAYDGYEEQMVDTVSAPKGSFSEKAVRLLGMTGSDTDFYLENDLAVKRGMIAVLPNWFISFIALILLFIVLKYLSGMTRRAYRKLRKDEQTDYRRTVLWQNKFYLLARILLAVVLIAVPIALIILFPPRIVLPADYVPYDNVFEIGHYLGTFTDHIQQTNANLSVGNGYYLHLFSHTMLLLCSCFAVLIVLSLTLTVGISCLVKKHKKYDRGSNA